MIVLNQSIAQARLWLACHPPARTEKVDQSTGRAYTTVVPREWIRAGGAALAACNLVLRASDSRAVVAPGGPALQQRFTLRHSYAPDEDAWTREQPLDTDAPMSLASAWAETRNLAGAIKGLLWDTSSEDVPDPSERPSKPVERGQSQRVIQEEARRNGNGHAKPSRKAVAAAANLAHVTLAGAPIAVELGDEDREKEAREHAEAERLRAQPSSVPPVPDAPGLMDDEPTEQPAKPAPSQAGEAGTAEPARSAVNPSTDAGATALRSEQADGTAPASGPNTDGGAPPSPLASSSAPLTSEASDPSEVGGGSLVAGTETPAFKITNAELVAVDVMPDGLMAPVFRNVEGHEIDAPPDEDDRSGERDTDDLSEPEPCPHCWADLPRGQSCTKPECVKTEARHAETLGNLSPVDVAAAMRAMTPLVGAVDSPEARAKAEALTMPALGPADLRGAKRAERLRSMGERPVLRELVKRGGGLCPACGVEFKKGDEVEVRGGKRRCVVCPGKAVTG